MEEKLTSGCQNCLDFYPKVRFLLTCWLYQCAPLAEAYGAPAAQQWVAWHRDILVSQPASNLRCQESSRVHK